MQTSSIYDKCDVKSHWKQYWHHKLFFIVTFLTGAEPGIKMISAEYFAVPLSSSPTLEGSWEKRWNVLHFDILKVFGEGGGRGN